MHTVKRGVAFGLLALPPGKYLNLDKVFNFSDNFSSTCETEITVARHGLVIKMTGDKILKQCVAHNRYLQTLAITTHQQLPTKM